MRVGFLFKFARVSDQKGLLSSQAGGGSGREYNSLWFDHYWPSFGRRVEIRLYGHTFVISEVVGTEQEYIL